MLLIAAISIIAGPVARAADNNQPPADDESLLEAYNKAVDNEGGNIFEKILAKLIVSVAAALHGFGRKFLGFKSLDALVFNKGVDNPEVIMNPQWSSTMNTWFGQMQVLSFPVVVIAVLVTGLRFIKAATNPKAREEAVESVLRLVLSAVLLLFAPVFVNVLLKLNNILVEEIASMINGSMDSTIGLSADLVDKIKTGSALLTAVVIIMFAFLEFRLNIMFFMRLFSITVLYIFTPFVTALWAIEKNVNAAGVWLGEIISNIFMQFAYAFVFMVFLAFVPYMGTGGTLICAMIIIPVAEMIRNSVQNLWIRLSGFDEAGASMKAAGMLGTIAAIPTLGKTIAAQFGGLGHAAKALGFLGGKPGTEGGTGTGGTSPTSGGPAGNPTGAADLNTTATNAAGTGTHIPVMGGSVSNARANVITGLGAIQTVANIAQMAAHAVTGIAALPAGQAGQQLAAGVGALTGMTVRAVGTPIAMAGAALATSIQEGKGIKGTGQAWKKMVGVQEGGWKGGLKNVYRSAQIIGSSTFSGLSSATEIINHQRQIDALDKMRP